MNNKRKKILMAILSALILSISLSGKIFTASGAELNPAFIASVKSIGSTVSTFGSKLITRNNPSPTSSPTFSIFPTGQIYVAPSVIVQPSQIIYPTATPTNYLVDNPPVFSTSTPIPIPTVIYSTPVPMPTYQIPTYQTPTQAPTLPKQPTSMPTTASQTNNTMADFGKCLTSKTMVMYSQEGCSSCAQQKRLLAEAYQFVTVINCTSTPKQCMNIGLKTTPSWAKDNKLVIPGFAALSYLSQVSGCQLPK